MKLSVIIPAHNRANFICQAIDSILGQTFKDFELIVVDDGSSDDVKQALAKYGTLINYIHQENKGRSEARNTGIKAAKGEYIAFLDDDDTWLPQKLEKQAAFFAANPGVGLVHTFTEVIAERGEPLHKATAGHFKLYKKAMLAGYKYQDLSELCFIFLSSVMVKKEFLNEIGFFDTALSAFEDWDLCLRFSLKYAIAVIPEALVKHRIHRTNVSLAELNAGRINTALKHLAMWEPCEDTAFRKKVSYNFCWHLANAYYIAKDWENFQKYAFKIFKLNPLKFFSRLGVHFLLSLKVFRFSLKEKPEARIIWNNIWTKANDDAGFWWWVKREATGARTNKITSYIKKHLGSINGLKTIEIGSGMGVHSLIFAKQGANVALLDYSKNALDYAHGYFNSCKLSATYIQVDALNINLHLQGKFDVAMSFGTVEHFRYPERFRIAQAHLDLARPGGVIIISVPNRYFFPHEILKFYLQVRNKWQLGYEGAFTGQELLRLGKKLGLENIEIGGSAFITDIFRYVRIIRGTQQDISPIDFPSIFDNLFGADIYLMGCKPT